MDAQWMYGTRVAAGSGVSDENRDALQVRAARRGLSLSAYVRGLLDEEAVTPGLADVFARSESSAMSSVDIIRADRAPTVIVVDCSVVVDAVTRRELGWPRRRLSECILHAPVLLDDEVINAFRALAIGCQGMEASGDRAWCMRTNPESLRHRRRQRRVDARRAVAVAPRNVRGRRRRFRRWCSNR